MKKYLFLLLILFCCSYSYAQCSDCTVPKENSTPEMSENKNCDKCSVEDDEYCVYNECYLDRKYRLMKQELCLSEKQESYIDNLYKLYKIDFETLCSKYKDKKNRILELIDSDDACWRDEIRHLCEIKSNIKERYNCFMEDTRDILNKKQRSSLNDFEKKQKKKLKRIIKYGAVYKLPCQNRTFK